MSSRAAPSRPWKRKGRATTGSRVPGALEIPQVLAQAAAAGLIPRSRPERQWDGAVALGCVISGETLHYDIVCRERQPLAHGGRRCATRFPSATAS